MTSMLGSSTTPCTARHTGACQRTQRIQPSRVGDQPTGLPYCRVLRPQTLPASAALVGLANVTVFCPVV